MIRKDAGSTEAIRLTIDEEVGTSGVGRSTGSEVEESTLQLLDVTLTTENGLTVYSRENFRSSSHGSLEETRRDGVGTS